MLPILVNIANFFLNLMNKMPYCLRAECKLIYVTLCVPLAS